jgi:hypothetical protein
LAKLFEMVAIFVCWASKPVLLIHNAGCIKVSFLD